jgi:hypothetical protein
VPASAYRITRSITGVFCLGTRERLQTINRGSIVIPTSTTDAARMIEATCEGERVRVFARDLEERSERVEVGVARA